MSDDLRKKIEKTLSDEDIREIKTIEPGINTLYEVMTNSGVYVFKFLKDSGDKQRFKAEALVYEKLGRLQGFPVPEVTYRHLSSNPPFFVLEKIDSENAGDIRRHPNQQQRKRFFYEYGTYLGLLHEQIHFSYYGEVKFEDNSLHVEHGTGSWKQRFGDRNGWRISEGEKWADKELCEKGKKALDQSLNYLPDSPQSVLLRQDNRLDNVLIDKKGNIEAIIDWGYLNSGHDLLDLVLTEYLSIDYDLNYLSKQKRQGLRYSLYEGYSSVREFKKGSEFRKIRAAYRFDATCFLFSGFPHWKEFLERKERKAKAKELEKRFDKAAEKIISKTS
ncbi:aminoglycoside phosphotransferase family protein [Candidatus Nanohalococcus occultus]|uniref:Aminoglycoside phosphotransferase n=1 Tax=Candidatus Nanohalococcus occultus TaxID=2978047 RepID=A0ABY8CE26_9ARCH|nr:Putative aminoglycoside phosphotransferase [Candidatus Nanohaloarchaeota archaeon SVXNc]